jgi:hypothetical protein
MTALTNNESTLSIKIHTASVCSRTNHRSFVSGLPCVWKECMVLVSIDRPAGLPTTVRETKYINRHVSLILCSELRTSLPEYCIL